MGFNGKILNLGGYNSDTTCIIHPMYFKSEMQPGDQRVQGDVVVIAAETRNFILHTSPLISLYSYDIRSACKGAKLK